MFYALAIGSMLGYTLQGILLVHHARKIDGLSLAFYRNASFVITLLPLCIGATRSDIVDVLRYWHFFVAAGLAGGLYLACSYSAYRSVPVSVVNTLAKAGSTLTVTIIGWWLFGEMLTPASVTIITIIILGCLSLGLRRQAFDHLDERHALGIMLSVASAIPWGVTYSFLTVVIRSTDPLISGYLWEIFIGLGAAALIAGRWLVWGIPLQRISKRAFFIIAACSSPTLIGTGLLSLALERGPIAIASAIGAGSLAVSALLAWMFYAEPLSWKKWLSLGVVLGGVVALRFV